MSTSKHAASLAVLCAAGLAATTAAMADQPAPAVTLSVPHPLDRVHAAQFYKRITVAAEQVCAPLDSKELERRRVYNACVADTIARAVAQVKSNELSAIHLAAAGAGNPRL